MPCNYESPVMGSRVTRMRPLVHHADGALQRVGRYALQHPFQQAAHLRVRVVPAPKQNDARTARHAEHQKPREVQVGRDDDAALSACDLQKRAVRRSPSADVCDVDAFVPMCFEQRPAATGETGMSKSAFTWRTR